MTPEAKITAAIIRTLKWLKADGHKLWYMKIHGGPMQRAGAPDLLVVWHGRPFFFEVKRPGEKPTRLQENTLRELGLAGAKCAVVTSAAEVLEVLL